MEDLENSKKRNRELFKESITKRISGKPQNYNQDDVMDQVQ